MSTTKSYGINQDYNGIAVGLWFDPAKVRVDDHAYVELDTDELDDLQRMIWDAITHREEPTPESMAWMITPRPTDSEILDRIAAYLSGKEWHAETIEIVAELIALAGREIEGPPNAPTVAIK